MIIIQVSLFSKTPHKRVHSSTFKIAVKFSHFKETFVSATINFNPRITESTYKKTYLSF